MNFQKNSDSVTQLIQSDISNEVKQVGENLEWLKNEMHPLFFVFNQAEVDALSLLTKSLHNMEYHKRLLLVDKPELTMLAQINARGSLYRTLLELPEKNISYAEVTTSRNKITGSDHGLEALRFDYSSKSESEIAEILKKDAVDGSLFSDDSVFTDGSSFVDGSKLKDGSLIKKIQAKLEKSCVDCDQVDIESYLKIVLANSPEYVHVSPPGRIARLISLYAQTDINDGIHLDMESIESKGDDKEYRILFGISNPPARGFLAQILEVFNRLNISLRRSYSLTLSNGIHPYFLSTFYVSPRDNSVFTKESDLYLNLQREIYNTQILSSRSRSYKALVKKGITSGTDASMVDAMISFCHTNLSHNHPDSFSLEGIRRAFHNHPEITTQLVDLFYARFDPKQKDREKIYAEKLTACTNAIAEFNSGRKFLDDFRRTVFSCGLSFIRYTLKTNFFVQQKHALSFRLSPEYLEELGERFTEDLPVDRPYRVTFFYSRNGIAYHIGFSDIARGGWRTIITQGRDNYITSANTMFKENYVLAHTQHLKNKDIYEGGSKMVAVLRVDSNSNAESNRQHLYKLQLAFINAFFDLFVTENGVAKNPKVVDYYAEDEPIELGPDENMHDVMIEIIAKQSVKRGYLLGPGVMSSKKVGINHKDYGVTSIGVIRFAEVTMESLGINMHKDEFSVKFTGGPNGDVAGNGMRLLMDRCPKVKIKLIIDGSGALFDPAGLDVTALDKVVLKSDLEDFDPNSLHLGGFLLYRNQTRKEGMLELYKKVVMTDKGLEELWISTDKFYKEFNTLAFTVEADLFIPAGGRPETIDKDNYQKYLTAQGTPSAKVIVEGANSYITPVARLELQRLGAVIIRDASANKCGVISSSYEIIANLMLSEEEFLANKKEYVEDVIAKLNEMAEREARLILERYDQNNGLIPYTDISNDISREINEHYARIFSYFSNNPELSNRETFQNAMLLHMPHLIGENEIFKTRLSKLPEKVKYAILASKLSSAMVYEGDNDSIYAGMIEAQVNKFPIFS
ncbi:NAD-glutamate dehydrogenase domain-containing protein [uncultured Cocleimonas sp.]|uniref:NAD-glutamate dehydrogenase domain-containing protein n=1 Tax=uncultured Cocleimonas sp. TaxID=1051587 RepID=UPI002624E0C9|nr:NAD-glutamate dehydrogenase domain-containing protein [uncultured Cocleimonas sp.]